MTSSVGNETCYMSNEQVKFYGIYAWWLAGIGSLSISTMGIILNTITICILCGKSMRSSFFNRLLVCLAIVDSLFLATAVSDAIGMQLVNSSSSQYLYIIVHLLYPARGMLICSSIYMTVGLACERYNSISKPHIHRNVQNTDGTCHRLLLYIAPVILLSVIYSIPSFFDLEVTKIFSSCGGMKIANETLETKCVLELHIITPTKIRNNQDYILWYINISNFAVTVAIPFILLTYFNYKIYKGLQYRRMKRASINPNAISRNNRTINRRQVEKNNRRKEARQTFILFAIVALFVMCHSLRVVLNIDEFINLETYFEKQKQGCAGIRFWTILASPISTLLLQINSGSPFFIYCFYDNAFKEALKSKLTNTSVYVQNTSRAIPTTSHWPQSNMEIIPENVELDELH